MTATRAADAPEFAVGRLRFRLRQGGDGRTQSGRWSIGEDVLEVETGSELSAKRDVRALAAFALVLAAMTSDGSATASGPPEMHTYVTVAGVRYHVATLEDRVHVTGDPVSARPSPETRELMRQAVVEATGCRIVEDRWVEAALRGKLDCTDQLPRKDW